MVHIQLGESRFDLQYDDLGLKPLPSFFQLKSTDPCENRN